MFQPLESRIHLAATMSATSPGTLLIDGTEAADVLSMRYRGARLDVRLNGALQTFVARDVQRIEIQTYAGNDIADWSGIAIPTYINAGLGNDLVYGGSGNDSLTGAAGKDQLYGNGGNDRVNGGQHNDIVYGGDGNDVLYGNEANDYLDGGLGSDRLFGDEGDDSLVGGLHNDGLYGGGGRDILLGQRGNDILSGDGGNDALRGGDGDDILYGGRGSDQISGEAGNDKIYARDNTIDNVQGGSGDDWSEADVGTDLIEDVEQGDVGLGGAPTAGLAKEDTPGINFNDEALWPENFTNAVNYAKQLGITTVRLWLDISDFSHRPKAYDSINYNDVVLKWNDLFGDARPDTAGLVMKRAFDLKRAGFTVLVTVHNFDGQSPANPAELKNFLTDLLNSTETPTSGMKFKDAVDLWEVGNEPDRTGYWNPAGSTSLQDRLNRYIDTLLLPASEVLHSGPVSTWEPVVMAGVAWSPDDLNTMLQRLKSKNRLDAIDFAGFHPYGTADEVLDNAVEAKQYADAVGKKLVATEWNLRGYPTNGSLDAQWAAANDNVYRNAILPNFSYSFYFAMADNYAPRGGGLARPASVLKHNTNTAISDTSPINDRVAWLRTPLVANEPFFSMFKTWQNLVS